MFSYYGSKSKLINLYPEPTHDTIIEPFAGSAQYAYKYWEHKVILVEKYERICNVWKWLIEEATPEFIMSLPLYQKSDKIIHPNHVVKDLLGLECTRGAEGSPRPTAGKYNRWSEKNGQGRERLANNLHKIKHWQVIYGDYSLAPDVTATWFVDPPYNCKAGLSYKCNCMAIDYDELGQWCKSRKGQVIACEDLGADWLPFEFLDLGSVQSAGKQNNNIAVEAIWTKND